MAAGFILIGEKHVYMLRQFFNKRRLASTTVNWQDPEWNKGSLPLQALANQFSLNRRYLPMNQVCSPKCIRRKHGR
jgi:hypothetical protein